MQDLTKIFKTGSRFKKKSKIGIIKSILKEKQKNQKKLNEKQQKLNTIAIKDKEGKKLDNENQQLDEKISKLEEENKALKEGKGNLQKKFGFSDIGEKEQEDLAMQRYGLSKTKIENKIKNTE